jgi:hypothetical protein
MAWIWNTGVCGDEWWGVGTDVRSPLRIFLPLIGRFCLRAVVDDAVWYSGLRYIIDIA